MTTISQTKPSVVLAALRSAVAEKKAPVSTPRPAATPARPSASKDVFETRTATPGSRLGGTNLMQTAESVQTTLNRPSKAEMLAAEETRNDNKIAELVGTARADFENASNEAKKADLELARLVSGFGPALTPRDQEKAIQSFKASRAEVYDRANDAAGKLIDAINQAGGNRDQIDEAYRGKFDTAVEQAKDLLPALANTEKGRDAIADAVAGLGTPEQADQSKLLLNAAGELRPAVQGATTAIAKSVGQRLLSLSKENVGDAQKLFDGVKHAGRFLGVSDEDVSKISDNLKDIAARKDGAVEALKANIDNAKVDVPGGNTEEARNALKSLGVAGSVAGLIGSSSEQDPASIIKTTSHALQITADSGSIVTGVLSSTNPTRFAGAAQVFDKLGGVAGLVGAVADVVSAVEKFKNKDDAGTIASLSTAAGGAILGATAFVSVPVVGQIVGGLLAVGGFIGGLITDSLKEIKEEQVAENSAKTYLEGGGVPSETSGTLADLKNKENVGPAIVQVAELMGVTPESLLKEIGHQPVDVVREFVAHAHAIPRSPDGKLQAHYMDGDDGHYTSNGSFEKYAEADKPWNLDGLRDWLKEKNIRGTVELSRIKLEDLLKALPNHK